MHSSRVIDRNRRPCANCAAAQVKCDIGYPFRTELCKKCSRDGLDRCPPHMSRRDAIKWKKSRGVIFRPAHSFSASVASDSSQGLRFSSPVNSSNADMQVAEELQLPESSGSHRRTLSSGDISLAESSSSFESEHSSQYTQPEPRFSSQQPENATFSQYTPQAYGTLNPMADFSTTPPEFDESYYTDTSFNYSRFEYDYELCQSVHYYELWNGATMPVM